MTLYWIRNVYECQGRSFS